MSFNRPIYDKCAYTKDLKEDATLLSYVLNDVPYKHCEPCRFELGVLGGNQVSKINGQMVDLDSDLRGSTRLLSRCPEFKYQQTNNNTSVSKTPYDYKNLTIDTSKSDLRTCKPLNTFPELVLEPKIEYASCTNDTMQLFNVNSVDSRFALI